MAVQKSIIYIICFKVINVNVIVKKIGTSIWGMRLMVWNLGEEVPFPEMLPRREGKG